MSIRDFLSQHSASGELIVLIASCIPAALTTKKLWREITEAKGLNRIWRWTEMGFLWLLPVMVFLSTKAVDWASDDALRGVKTEMQSQIDEAKAASRPKPFRERLIAELEAINSNIITELRSGKTHFSIDLQPRQYTDLEGLASEPGATAYITFQRTGTMGVVAGIGQLNRALITLNRDLLSP